MLSAQPLIRPPSQATPIWSAWPLTFDIPQGEVSIAGGFRGQGEEEAMSRLRLVSVHHANGVDQLMKRKAASGEREIKTRKRKERGKNKPKQRLGSLTLQSAEQ